MITDHKPQVAIFKKDDARLSQTSKNTTKDTPVQH